MKNTRFSAKTRKYNGNLQVLAQKGAQSNVRKCDFSYLIEVFIAFIEDLLRL